MLGRVAREKKEKREKERAREQGMREWDLTKFEGKSTRCLCVRLEHC